NVVKHEAILGVPWLRRHNSTINWGENKITFGSEPCAAQCLRSSPIVETIPEEQAIKENLRNKIFQLESKEVRDTVKNTRVLSPSEERIRVVKLKTKARLPTKGSKGVAGHDLYAIELMTILDRGEAMVKTGIALGLPSQTYARIAPRSGLA